MRKNAAKFFLFFKTVILLFTLNSVNLVQAQNVNPSIADSPIEVEQNWQAQWIANPSSSVKNQWLIFRKKFDIKSIPEKLEAKIAVDTKYWLFLNGKLVVREGGLKRGPSPTGTYFDVVDLKPYLQVGNNSIAVLVWHFGKNGFSHNSSGQAGLLFEASQKDINILSDETWKTAIHPAFSLASGDEPNFRLAESSIRFDSRKEILNWYDINFNEQLLSSVKVLGRPPMSPWGELVRRPIPQWKDFGLQNYTNQIAPILTQDETIIKANLPYNAQVTPYLKIESPAGLVIDMRTDNFNGGQAPNVHAEYVTKDGPQEFEAFGWMNGHQVIYKIPRGVKIIELKYRETGYNSAVLGKFESDDGDMNTLWTKAERTLYITMRDNFMDCPDRERAQWWGDAVNEIGESFYVFESGTGPLLAKKAIYELIRWKKNSGQVYSPIPAGRVDQGKDNGSWTKELPLQSLASIGWYGIWNYYLNTGDIEVIRFSYPTVKQYLNLWKVDSNGLVQHRSGDWDWGDWGKNIDMPVLENAWYFLALRGAMAMASELGNTQDASNYAAMLERMQTGFMQFWNGTSFSSGTIKVIDDRAQALAVVAGLVPPNYYGLMVQSLTSNQQSSPYMEKYVLEALYVMGAPNVALARMRARYKDQIQSPITTLWEGWGIGDRGYGGGTYNHAWSGGPLTVLSQYAAGISPQSPGWKNWNFSPQMGSFNSLISEVPTPYGLIHMSFKRVEKKLIFDLDVPKNTVAEFQSYYLQQSEPVSAISVDGTLLDLQATAKLLDGHHQIILELGIGG